MQYEHLATDREKEIERREFPSNFNHSMFYDWISNWLKGFLSLIRLFSIEVAFVKLFDNFVTHTC